MHYKNNKRTYITDFKEKDDRGYVKVQDKETKVYFFLPEFVVKEMVYQFSWDRYSEDLDKTKVLKAIELEILRIKKLSFTSFNTRKGLEDMERFKLSLKD